MACASLTVMALLLLGWPSGCSPKGETQSPSLETRTIRVRLVPGVDQVAIRASQPPVYYTTADSTLKRLELPANMNVPVTLSANGWMIGSTCLGGGQLIIRPTAVGAVRINDAAYRGQFRFVSMGYGRFDVINDVDIEDYLKSVVSKELLASWREETYKAQAIVARTYAMYEKYVPRNEPRQWDVYADTRSQVYGGIDAETPKSREAVDATAGIVVAAGPRGQERIFKAYFSSCCGGITQSSMHAFKEQYSDVLSEQYVGALCSASPRFTWPAVTVRKDELTRRIRIWSRGARPEKDIGMVRSVDIEQRNRFGRPVRYTILDDRGVRYSLTGEEIRWAVNTDAAPGTTLNSSFVESVVNDTEFVRFLGGHGFGHGVGMCQWCAEARARSGMRHEDIVILAYPGSRLLPAY
ncbi:MAG TPA: SpoIID/LytB domain-containing protein [Tepidisphaeraceae bacterium]|nr:SpoIID/LytB domain-containing protein [Tepidisphaeraceae bacterium]